MKLSELIDELQAIQKTRQDPALGEYGLLDEEARKVLLNNKDPEMFLRVEGDRLDIGPLIEAYDGKLDIWEA